MSHGRPLSLYTDKASHFVCNAPESIEEQLLGRPSRTQIGRALEELDIELILAHSPQAKGRVERLFGTLQDRLVKLMRLEGINGLDSANRYLKERFLPDWNRRFTCRASSPVNAHRSASGYDLGAVFSHKESRTVTNDYTLSYKGRRYQIEKRSLEAGLRGGRVLVEERLNGQIKVVFRGQYLKVKQLPIKASKRRETPALPPGLVGGWNPGSATLRLASTRRQAQSCHSTI
jgi:hypothetical protein